jgi:hypothetical protein
MFLVCFCFCLWLYVRYAAAVRPRAAVLSELKQHSKERPLTMLFWPPLPPAESVGMVTSTPAVPRIFTGKSRLGEADGGYLCERFTQKRFITECANDARIGSLL